MRKRSFRSFASFPLRLPPSFCFPLVSFCIFDAREEEAPEAKSVARSLFPFQEPFCFQDVALLLNPTLIPHKNTSSKNEIQKHNKNSFTGADLAALVRSAATLAAEEGEDGAESVGARHFAEALRTARPSRRVGGGNGDEDAKAEQRVFASFSRPGLG